MRPDLRPGRGWLRVGWRCLGAVTVLAGALVGCGSASPGSSADPFPDVALTAASDGGAEIATGDWVGEPLVVNFWYSTCAPCTKELTDFAEVHAEVGDDVRLVGVNPLDGTDTMIEFAAARGVTYELFRDELAELQMALEITSFPATVFVDAAGQVVDTTGVLDADELRDEIDELRDTSGATT
ncbi:MAG: TlpA disulfide reductase family protein [Actinomycetota bacterium]